MNRQSEPVKEAKTSTCVLRLDCVISKQNPRGLGYRPKHPYRPSPVQVTVMIRVCGCISATSGGHGLIGNSQVKEARTVHKEKEWRKKSVVRDYRYAV